MRRTLHIPYLEFNIVEHCNNRCEGCSHFSPHVRSELADLPEFRRDLASLAAVLRTGLFRFTGGEPLLHPELGDFIEAVRESRIAKKIAVCTNGAILPRMDDAFYRRIDVLAISRYPKTPPDDETIARTRRTCADHHVECAVYPTDRFFVTLIPTPIDDASLRQKIYDTCLIAHRWRCHTFRQGRFYLCSTPTVLTRYLTFHGRDGPDFGECDGVDLRAPSLAERLHAYLTRPQPLASCRFCLGGSGKSRPWRELAPRELAAPAEPDYRPEERIDDGCMQYLMRWNRIERICTRILPFELVRKALNSLVLRRMPAR